MQEPKTIFSQFRRIFIIPIWIYQHMISPFLPDSCIYSPTCSNYYKHAILTHGIFKGNILGITRIFRCAGGLFVGGDDPVPEKFTFHHISSSYRTFRRKRKKNYTDKNES